MEETDQTDFKDHHCFVSDLAASPVTFLVDTQKDLQKETILGTLMIAYESVSFDGQHSKCED